MMMLKKMFKKVIQFLIVFLFVISLSNLTYAASKQDQLNKISEDLTNIKRLLEDGVLDQGTYEKSKKKLLKRKEKLLNKDKPKKTKNNKNNSLTPD